ncbi:creatininase family protein [Petroclostridium sp. X23]|uniref:creatininase family protein n=1 Tax=Petroclostridium sp. X23 TaxID=3045146 RepID=UPI0024AC8BB3|nr:creatininase family protein [Petroclostridium sp. X23]WHH56829.1 creatininase family protein [Petroclostridium sp. X23]
MQMEKMFPRELERAKKDRTPVVITIGTIEYHGPHCAFGCDTQIVTGLLRELEKERNIVVYPPIWYGVASYAVGGPETNTVHVNADTFEDVVYNVLKSMLYGGFRNIYLMNHHQYEYENLLPMTLACMKAAKKLTLEFLEDQMGIGWWGSNDNQEFYKKLESDDNPWNWIKVIPALSKEVQQQTGYDHAGKYESSILRVLYPECVKMERLSDSDEWFIQSAIEGSKELGEKMRDLALDYLRRTII